MTEIEKLIDERKWKPAQAMLQRELLSAPTDHWLWYTLSLAYYEQHEYELSLQCAKRAVELQPDCPLALWHYAGSLYMTGRESAALAIWNLLLNLDLEVVADGECGEGMSEALRLMNDVHYRMGRCFQKQGKTESAVESFKKYLHNRSHGVASTYDERPVKAFLDGLVVGA